MERLASPAAPGAVRRLAADDAEGLMAAILCEVDETMLGRELDFRNGRGETVGLDVLGRRLLRVRAIAPADRAAPFPGLAGTPLADPQAPAAAALRALLAEFVAGSDSLTVTARKLARRPQSADLGCAPQALAEAWGLVLRDDGPEGIAGFIAACDALADAWLALENRAPSARSGDPALAARLAAIAAAGIALPERNAPGCIVLDGPGGAQLLLYGRDGGQEVLMAFPADRLEAVLDAWQRALG